MMVTPHSRQQDKTARLLAAFVADDQAVSSVNQAVSELDIASALVTRGSITDAVRRLGKMQTPKTLILDIGESTDPITHLTELADVCDEGTAVIIVGALNDIGLYRQLVGLGVRDYLLKPLTTDDLKAAISRASLGVEEVDPKIANRGRLICVVGARGGAGATSSAVNIAWLIAHEHKRRTALVDLDLFFGTCGLALDLDVGRGFREALENPSRIDALFIERAMARESEMLYVLSAEETLDQNSMPDPSAVEFLIDHLRHDFPYVVMDLPRFAARTQMGMLTTPASLVIVADPTLGGMRDTMRLAELARKTVSTCELTVVLDRVGACPASEIDRAQFEKTAEIKVAAEIPFEAKAFAAAVGAGKPSVSVCPRAKSSLAMRELTVRLTGGGRKRTNPSLIARLMQKGA